MTISVALCTFRGARFLRAQLDSIAAGTLFPDELVVFDDASGDETVGVIRDFAATAPFSVWIEEQPQNVGLTANFGAAVGRCSGDVIVLCDQDDLWHPDKLRKFQAAFAAHPDAAVVMSDARLIDEAGVLLAGTLWEQLGFKAPQNGRFERGEWVAELVSLPKVTGATMAFRAVWKPLVLPFEPVGPWIHDTWIAMLCSGVAPAVILPETLLDYRRHPAQQTEQALRRRTLGGRRRQTASQLDLQLAQLREVQRRWTDWQAADQARQLEARCAHLENRLRFRRHRGLARVWGLFFGGRELFSGRYHRYSNGWPSFAADLLF